MIRQFQEKNFNQVYVHTTKESGYENPKFEKIAEAYGFDYKRIEKESSLNINTIEKPTFFEIFIDKETYLTPNWGEKDDLYSDMKPCLNRDFFSELLNF